MSSQSHLVTSNIINRVVHIRAGGTTGTAFTIELSGRQYLITARHVLGGNGLEKIWVEHENWIPINVRIVGISERNADVAVLATDVKLTATHEIELGMKDMAVSQDIRFLGFPLGLRMGYANNNKGKEIPMVKAGILSGIGPIGDGIRGTRLWLDGHNNKGFSGGPIIYKDVNGSGGFEQPWKIAGVVSGYVNEEVEIEGADGNVIGFVKGNSGILAGVGIEIALDMINENPIGYQL